jgi:hypothetical protein
MKDALIKTLLESIDLKKLANGVVDNVIEEALKKVVADTSNPIDDMVMTSLWPLLEVEVKKLIEEHLDLAKILKLDAE